jgi:two-component system phosphate regulon response regulator OmpR
MMEPQAHLLVVDDDDRIRGLLQKYLMRNGFLVTIARDAAQARRLLQGLEFDLIVLDVMMPGEDGISLARDLRGRMATPILMLTARGEAANRIEGLEAGADDYLVKPFEPKELLLRVGAILRRLPAAGVAEARPKMLHLGPVRYDVERGELWRGGDPVRLTATEAQLMRIFAAKPGEAVARERMSRSQDSGARSRPTRNSPAICKPCAGQAICCSRIDSCGTHLQGRMKGISVLVLSHPDGLLHDTPKGHPERVERLHAVEQGLASLAITRRDCPLGDWDDVLRAHGPAYVTKVREAAPETDRIPLDADTWMSPGTLNAALRAVGGVCAAVDAVIAGDARRAFVATRPPGHHA